MTEFRKQSDGSLIIGESMFRREFPNVSIPKPLTEENVNSLGYDWVFDGAWPTTTPPYQRVQRDGVEQIDGKWYTEFKVVTATGDDATEIDNQTAANRRAKRDELLKETDFYALSDVTMSDEMKTYRQELRDLPASSGADWPHNVTWPTKPS
tara:strand:+ start:5817 stop:6272 length:456 start_codon:yes stop_codon:yes gene_type:complete